jgi:hypothetical protein
MEEAIALAKNLASARYISFYNISTSLDDFDTLDEEQESPVKSTEQILLDLLVESLACSGEALLDIGVDSDGISLKFSKTQFDDYIASVKAAADGINADATLIYERNSQKYGSAGEKSIIEPFFYGHLLLRNRDVKVHDILESRVAGL